jgi:hypothetical protein
VVLSPVWVAFMILVPGHELIEEWHILHNPFLDLLEFSAAIVLPPIAALLLILVP